MQTLGNWLQLLGYVITAAGLFHAWKRASSRFDEWRDTLRTRLTELRAFVASRGQGVKREGGADLAIGFKTDAGGEVQRGGTDPERLKRVEHEVEDLQDGFKKLTSSLPAQINDAIAADLEKLESLSNAIRLKDISWAIAGIAVSAAGIIIQLCA
jgi:hypothetical protein